MAYLLTFDLSTPADYQKAHEALERRDFRREWNRVRLPDTTWFYNGGMSDAVKTCRDILTGAGVSVTRLVVVQADTVAAWDVETSTEYRVI